MSDATLSDPRARAAQNRWYLYYTRDSLAPQGEVRAVIEELCDEQDTDPRRAVRRVYLHADYVRDAPRPPITAESACHDRLDRRIERDMSDEEFMELIDAGTIIPIPPPQ